MYDSQYVCKLFAQTLKKLAVFKLRIVTQIICHNKSTVEPNLWANRIYMIKLQAILPIELFIHSGKDELLIFLSQLEQCK
jgi:hypothetical protein